MALYCCSLSCRSCVCELKLEFQLPLLLQYLAVLREDWLLTSFCFCLCFIFYFLLSIPTGLLQILGLVPQEARTFSQITTMPTPQIHNSRDSQGIRKEHACTYCSRTFRRAEHLLRHIRTRTFYHTLTHEYG